MKENDRRKGNSGRKPFSRYLDPTKTTLINERLSHGWSHAKMADMMGISRSQYTKVESGISRGSKDFWNAAARVLGVTKDFLKEN